jgi:hypothetical protein
VRQFLQSLRDDFYIYSIVPDKGSRNIPEVVLVRRWAVRVLEFGGGKGLGEGWDKGGSVYKQPETEVDDSCHS